MIIGAIIAMLFIFGLFLSMIASPPHNEEDRKVDTVPVTE